MGHPDDIGTNEEVRKDLNEKLTAAKKRILFLAQTRSKVDADDVMRELVNVIDVLSVVVKRLP
jgi:hypothetical protein